MLLLLAAKCSVVPDVPCLASGRVISIQLLGPALLGSWRRPTHTPDPANPVQTCQSQIMPISSSGHGDGSWRGGKEDHHAHFRTHQGLLAASRRPKDRQADGSRLVSRPLARMVHVPGRDRQNEIHISLASFLFLFTLHCFSCLEPSSGIVSRVFPFAGPTGPRATRQQHHIVLQLFCRSSAGSPKMIRPLSVCSPAAWLD